MTQNQTLLYLSALIKERRNDVVEGMARGTDKFEAYQHACGQVRGYDTVQVMISDLISVHEKEEEDFDSSPTDTVISINKKGDK